MIDFTPIVRKWFERLASRTDDWGSTADARQVEVLRGIIRRGGGTEYGRKLGLCGMDREKNMYAAFSRVPLMEYEEVRPLVMRMIRGEGDVLWRGRCRDYAQSSGTSGGKSKFIPITADSLRGNHYRGGADAVAHYLRQVGGSRLFAGKNFILGGSFSNTIGVEEGSVHVGDLSATLIRRINPLANLVRIPDKKTALMPDWEKKLPALVRVAGNANVTGISGVPSWFLTVIRDIMKEHGADRISDVWPNLEVFFHGGISFEPYRDEYRRITDPEKMHFLETYNASEGFFAVQNDFSDPSMLLIIDSDVFYEFIPIDGDDGRPRPVWELEKDRVYELVITGSNGLWRYRIGDTVRVTQTAPVKIRIAGRTKCYINAFGEELMEDNAERAVGAACRRCGCSVLNYTAAPQYASGGQRGRHQWLVEWGAAPSDTRRFAETLDEELRRLNSDYDAKRTHSIFLDMPEVITVRPGLFDRWLKSEGSHKLGGQRKVPRLSNDRMIVDALLKLAQISVFPK